MLQTMTTLKEQSAPFLNQLANRRRNQVAEATKKAYESYLRIWIVPVVGDIELKNFDNGVMRNFVSLLVEKDLKPATIQSIVTVTKMVIRSETDGNGNILNPREWNQSYIDAPIVDFNDQNAPVIEPQRLNAALLTAFEPYRSLYVLAAGSGMRMGELLSVRMGPDDGISTIWDPETAIVYVRLQIYDQKEKEPKSSAGVREVDIYSKLNSWLVGNVKADPGAYLFQTRNGTLKHKATIYDHLEIDNVPGMHSFRRFRKTHLENMGVTPALIDYWIGHKGKTVSDRYNKFQKFKDHRRGWCEKAGLGFDLPECI